MKIQVFVDLVGGNRGSLPRTQNQIRHFLCSHGPFSAIWSVVLCAGGMRGKEMGLIAARFKSGADRASALWVSRNKNSWSGHQPGDCDDEIGARSPQGPPVGMQRACARALGIGHGSAANFPNGRGISSLGLSFLWLSLF